MSWLDLKNYKILMFFILWGGTHLVCQQKMPLDKIICTPKSGLKRRSNLQSVVGEEAALKFDDGTQAANVMGKMGILRKTNEFG